MTDDPTVTVDGIEVDAQDLIDAIDEAKVDGESNRASESFKIDRDDGGVGSSGDVFVFGDIAADSDAYLYDGSDKTSLTAMQKSYDEATTALEPPFAEVVREIMSKGTYTIQKPSDTDTRHSTGDVIVAKHDDGSGFIVADDLESLFDDERVTVEGVKDGFVRLCDNR